MPDLQIDVKTTFKGEGLEQAQEQVSETSKAVKTLTDESDKQAKAVDTGISKAFQRLGQDMKRTGEHGRTFHVMLRQIGYQFPVIGHLAHAAFNPLTLLVGGAVAALKKFTEVMKGVVEALQPAKFITLNEVIKAQAAAVREADLSAVAYERSLLIIANRQDTVTESTDKQVAALQRKARIQDELQDRQKAISMAKVDLEEKTGALTGLEAMEKRSQIEESFEKARIARANKTADAEIGLRQRELAQLNTLIPQLEAAYAAADAARRGAGSEAADERRMDRAERQLEEDEKALAKMRIQLPKTPVEFGARDDLGKAIIASEEQIVRDRENVIQMESEQYDRRAARQEKEEELQRAKAKLSESVTRRGALGPMIEQDLYRALDEENARTRAFKLGQEERGLRLQTAGTLTPEAALAEKVQGRELIESAKAGPMTESVVAALGRAVEDRNIRDKDVMNRLVTMIMESVNTGNLSRIQMAAAIEEVRGQIRSQRLNQ